MNGAQFKAWREVAGLSQTEAAERLNIGRRSLIRYEQAPGEGIPPKVAAKITDAPDAAEAPAAVKRALIEDRPEKRDPPPPSRVKARPGARPCYGERIEVSTFKGLDKVEGPPVAWVERLRSASGEGSDSFILHGSGHGYVFPKDAPGEHLAPGVYRPADFSFRAPASRQGDAGREKARR
jgi:transcriptional regulator with XRE-family HTH domain